MGLQRATFLTPIAGTVAALRIVALITLINNVTIFALSLSVPPRL